MGVNDRPASCPWNHFLTRVGDYVIDNVTIGTFLTALSTVSAAALVIATAFAVVIATAFAV